MSQRRQELLDLSARLFAERGYGATTVRDIADEAGILSGSLYHHFSSKEQIVDEILSTFLDELFSEYRRIMAQDLGARQKLEAVVVESFRCIDRHHAAVAIFQNEAGKLAQSPRFSYLNDRGREFRALWRRILQDGVRSGAFRTGLDVDLVFRFLRDTVWVAVRWYRPGGPMSAETVAAQYLDIVLDGIAARRGRSRVANGMSSAAKERQRA
ncbi:MAG: TetR/AcrR family transcriptional regulator [Actinomycetota bacterium]|nr:TetR/AcrR family transcriptional regulator [Actinomycetota bacterium]